MTAHAPKKESDHLVFHHPKKGEKGQKEKNIDFIEVVAPSVVRLEQL